MVVAGAREAVGETEAMVIPRNKHPKKSLCCFRAAVMTFFYPQRAGLVKAGLSPPRLLVGITDR